MGTDRNRKRLERIESSLTPKEIVALWIEDLAKFNSTEDYISWIAEDSSRSPLPKMLPADRKRYHRASEWPRQKFVRQNSPVELLRRRSSEVMFLYNLLFQMNRHVHEFVARKNFTFQHLNVTYSGRQRARRFQDGNV